MNDTANVYIGDDAMTGEKAELKSRISQGACLLDDQQPLWERRIDLTRFRMNSPIDDVLGQLFGSYAYGLSMLKWPRRTIREAAVSQRSCGWLLGFSCSPTDYQEAEAAWRREIEKRLEDVVSNDDLDAVAGDPLKQEEVDRIARAVVNARLCDGCGDHRPFDPEHPDGWSTTDSDGCLWHYCVVCTWRRNRKEPTT